MLFNSIEFLVFFPVVTLLFYLIPHRFRWIHLLLASCVFYAAFIPAYLLVLALLIGIDYSAGILIERSHRKKLWLTLSIVANLTLLCIFKYYNFFVSNINEVTGTDLVLLHFVLPIGLSFHTFQSMAYTIEVYYGRQMAVKHLGYYALYVMFYPQLVAGPIERPQHLFPQLFKSQRFSWQHIYEGLRLMAWGFFKKVVIADRVGQFADAVFSNTGESTVAQIWLAVFFFSIQIYADFSGYSDIAIGAARCMGIDLTTNFNRPYFAINIREFWQRWHISLSRWFRDYVYIPLGGNRVSAGRQHLNLMLTFMLSGFWHGAAWTFVIWGLLHGSFIVIFNSFKRRLPDFNMARLPAWLLTGLCVGMAWIFFRASSVEHARRILFKSIQLQELDFQNLLLVPNANIQFGNFTLALSLGFIIYMAMVEMLTKPKLFDLNTRPALDISIFASAILSIIFFGVFKESSFIYFQF